MANPGGGADRTAASLAYGTRATTLTKRHDIQEMCATFETLNSVGGDKRSAATGGFAFKTPNPPHFKIPDQPLVDKAYAYR